MTFGTVAPKQLSDGNSQGTQLGVSGNTPAGVPDKIAFFGATPVVQQATTGTSTGFTANAGTAMNSLSTSTGGIGTKAYTYGDVILALKNLGLLAT